MLAHDQTLGIAKNLNQLGRLPAAESLDLTIALPLRNRAALTNLLQQIYDPGSPDYHHYLTPSKFAEQFGPSETDYQTVIAFAKANGLTISGTHRNRTLLDVRGPVAAIEKTFHVRMLVYPHPTENRTFFAPDTEPSLDLNVAVLTIRGLDNFSRPHPKSFKTVPLLASGQATPDGGSGTGGTFLGNDFRAAYAPGVTLDGSGQTVGLLEFDGYYSNDIAAYETLAGLTNVPLQNVLVDGFNGSPGGNNGEVALDIEMAVAMAPGLSQVMIYETGLGGYGDDLLNQMATDNLAKQISCSWNFGIDSATEQIFQQFAAQGQSFFNASGDADAYTSDVPNPDDDPNITIVGGTTLTTSGAGGNWVSETTWNEGNGVGSSGGISANYSIPSWQQGINMTTNKGSTTYRNIPDVAMVANNVQVVFNNGTTEEFIGTSCAAPLWAGFMALVNQQAATTGKPTAGFINPAIYAIGKGTNYAASFHDITTGNNFKSSSPNLFSAVPGYDLCTGWGTPSGSNLITALATPEPLYITPLKGFTANGPAGGPFNATNESLTLTNFGSASLNWTLSNPSNWLNLSATNGTLTPGGAAKILTASLNPIATSLSVGNYTNILYFTNRTDASVQARRFVLQVWASLAQNGGFESGDFSGWTESGNTEYFNVVKTSAFVHSGVYGGQFGPAGALGYLSQTVATAGGQPYLLSFWVSSTNTTATNEFNVSWNGTPLFDQINLKFLGWTNLQFLVTATGTGTVLQFGFRDDSSFLGLDDVSVTSVPVPLLQNVVHTGSKLVFNWSTLPGIKYQLQYQTNLLQTNWLNLGNATTATNTSATGSDSIGSSQQRFYRLLLTH